MLMLVPINNAVICRRSKWTINKISNKTYAGLPENTFAKVKSVL